MAQRRPKKRTLTGGSVPRSKKVKRAAPVKDLVDSEDDELPIRQELDTILQRQRENEHLLSQHNGELFYVHTAIASGPGHLKGVQTNWPGRVQRVVKNSLVWHRAVCATVPGVKYHIEPLRSGNLLLSGYLSFGTCSIVALHVGK